MKKTQALVVAILGLFILGCSAVMVSAEERDMDWVPSEGSTYVENSMLKLVTDDGYNGQGIGTIVDGFNKMQAGNPDFIWYGEYEYMSLDGGTTWNMLPGTADRTVTDIVLGQQYQIDFDTSGTPLAVLGTITKVVTIVTGPDEPLANIEYSFAPSQAIASVMLYYAIDYCDWQTTGDSTDDVYDFTGTQVVTAQWLYGINGLFVDTLGSGYGVIKTDYLADYYAGFWDHAMYQNWGTGYNIDNVDDGIGVVIDFGAVVPDPSYSRDLYIGIYTEEEPPVGIPDFPSIDVSVMVAVLMPLLLLIRLAKSKRFKGFELKN